jgi:hypothetical protein
VSNSVGVADIFGLGNDRYQGCVGGYSLNVWSQAHLSTLACGQQGRRGVRHIMAVAIALPPLAVPSAAWMMVAMMADSCHVPLLVMELINRASSGTGVL